MSPGRAGRSSRDKGARGERQVADLFRRHGFDVNRVPNSGGLRLKGDLYGDVPCHVEVKNQQTVRMPAWSLQAELEAGDGAAWLVAFKMRARWYGCQPLDELASLYASARDTAPLVAELRAALAELIKWAEYDGRGVPDRTRELAAEPTTTTSATSSAPPDWQAIADDAAGYVQALPPEYVERRIGEALPKLEQLREREP